MLKYLFTARFTDGSIIEQKQEDKSVLDEKRNAFYDVLNSDKEIETITYHEQVFWNPTKIVIDYQTGIFNINGLDVYSEPLLKDDKELVVVKREPIRYMVVQQDFLATYDTKTRAVLDVKPTDGRRTFYVGWKTNIDGKNYQRIIGVK